MIDWAVSTGSAAKASGAPLRYYGGKTAEADEKRGVVKDIEGRAAAQDFSGEEPRDLGADLGVGGHLTSLRRTHIGVFDVADAVGADDITPAALLDPAMVAALVQGRFDVSHDEARDLWNGKRIGGRSADIVGETAAAIDPDGRLVGIVERRGTDVKSRMNVPPPAPQTHGDAQ